MSAQRKLISVLRPLNRSRQATSLSHHRPNAWVSASARSITTTPTLFRPTAAENVPESGKQEDKTVPSEQITKEAKEAEPDAVEQNEEVSRFQSSLKYAYWQMEKKGMDNLPTQT
jgi:hypothetical protein